MHIVLKHSIFLKSGLLGSFGVKTKANAKDKVAHASSEQDNIEVELNEENQIDQSETWHREEYDIQPQIDDDGEEGKEGYLLA